MAHRVLRSPGRVDDLVGRSVVLLFDRARQGGATGRQIGGGGNFQRPAAPDLKRGICLTLRGNERQ